MAHSILADARLSSGEPRPKWAGATEGRDAIQEAVDSDATHVYLPRGRYKIEGAVEIRGEVAGLVNRDEKVWTAGYKSENDGVLIETKARRRRRRQGTG